MTDERTFEGLPGPEWTVSPYEAMRLDLIAVLDYLQPELDELEELERQEAEANARGAEFRILRERIGYSVRVLRGWVRNLDAGMDLLTPDRSVTLRHRTGQEYGDALKCVVDYLYDDERQLVFLEETEREGAEQDPNYHDPEIDGHIGHDIRELRLLLSELKGK